MSLLMWRKLALVFFALTLAFAVLAISVLRTAAVKYEFGQAGVPQLPLGKNDHIDIDYQLVSPGPILPDNFLWPLKALRDAIWLKLTTNPARLSELYLLLADKRLSAAAILFERGAPEVGLSTLTKGEKYLEEASNQEKENRKNGLDTTEFLHRIALASLKHYEVTQGIYDKAPQEAKPVILQSQDHAKRAYETARNALLEKGIAPPENPFGW